MSNKFTSDMSSFFNRTIQKAEEAFSTTEKTPIDANIEKLTQDCQTRQKWATSLIGLAESVAEPNPANRVEDKVLQTMDRKKSRLNEHAKLGESLISIGERLDSRSPHAVALTKAGQCEEFIGNATQELQRTVESSYSTWLREYLQNTCKPALSEREKLDNLRLDLDRAKTLLKRAGNDAAKKQHVDTSAMPKHEQQVSEAQTLFDRQLDLTRRHLEQCIQEFDKHRDVLRQLLVSQRDYHEKCVKALETALN